MARSFKLNRAGVRALRTTDGARTAVEKKAEQGARAAGNGYQAVSGIGKNRARAAIIPTKDTPRGKKGRRALDEAIRAMRR